MKTVKIPGGTVDLREQDEVKVRHHRLIESAVVAAASALVKLPDTQEELEKINLSQMGGLTKDEADSLFELQDATIVASLIAWSLPEPLPTLETVGDLDQETYNVLATATQSLGAAVASGTSFEPGNPAAPGFEDSPTPPSDDSVVGLRADEASVPTQPPSDTTRSIATAPSLGG